MDTAFLNALASYSAHQPNWLTIAAGAAVGLLLAAALGYAFARVSGSTDEGAGTTIVFAVLLAGIGATGVAVLDAHRAAADPTPTAIAQSAVTDYLEHAHDLTVTGPIALTTGKDTHTDLAHSPGRADTTATTTDGQLLAVTVTWNDPSTGPADTRVTTAPPNAPATNP